MSNRKPQSDPPADDYRINFFRPRPGYMRQKVTYIWILLTSWAVFSFGFQLILAWTSRNPEGEGPLTDLLFFGFPFHFWFTGHFLIVWFIFLCFLFNSFIDRLTRTYRQRK